MSAPLCLRFSGWWREPAHHRAATAARAVCGSRDGRTVRAVKKCTPFQLECLLWGIHLKRRIRHKRTDLCTKVFIAALSVVVKNTEPNEK